MSVDLKPLDEQIIVITGASSGIGLATARMAAQRGARLVLAARNEAALHEIAEDLSRDTDVEVVVADVGREEDVRAIGEAAVRRFGRIDTWVNNAGVSIYGHLAEITLEDHRRLFETNYWGVVHGSLEALRRMRERGGAIVNTGSIASDKSLAFQGAYSASKHAVRGFTDALRAEVYHDDLPISVTLIKPGAMDTPITLHAKNYMEYEPTLPPPVYSPELSAEAILHAAEHSVREMTVGGGGFLMKTLGNLFPRLSDMGMGAAGLAAQQRNLPKDPDRQSSLHRPGRDGQMLGAFPGPVRETSLFLKMQQNPATALALFSVAGVALSALASVARGRHRG